MRVGEKRRSRSALIYASIFGGILIISLFFVIRFIDKNAQVDTLVEVSDTSFEVMGLHGAAFGFDSISSVELKDTMPAILERTNGFAVDEVRKGSFVLEDLGECILYLTVEQGSYLYVKMEDFYVIINFEDSEKTVQLYDELKDKTGK